MNEAMQKAWSEPMTSSVFLQLKKTKKSTASGDIDEITIHREGELLPLLRFSDPKPAHRTQSPCREPVATTRV